MLKEEAVMKGLQVSKERLEKARPIISKLLHGGRILPVEGDPNEICHILDLTCGTDYMQIYDDKDIVWGIASRIQTYDPDRGRPFNTFTIRNKRESGQKTEYEKRRDAINRGGIYPYLTMQAYVNARSGEIDSLAITKTTDLMDFIIKKNPEVKHTGDEQIGQAEFFVVRWYEM